MSSSGPKQGGAAADGGAYGAIAWTSAASAVVENGSVASAVLGADDITHYLDITNFDSFAEVAAGDVITGVLVEAKCRTTGSSINVTLLDLIVGGTPLGAAPSGSTFSNGTLSYQILNDSGVAGHPVTAFGKASDLLGSEVNDSGFGVRMALYCGGSATVEIDSVQITLTGSFTAGGGAPQLTVTGVADNGTYAFSPVATNTATSHQFTLTNTGTAEDTLGTLSITGTGWSISGADNPSGLTIAASGTRTVTATGNFATAGAKTGALTIPSNDAASPYVINLTATAFVVSAAITGTAAASITEADIVTGGKTIIITLTNDTWVTAGALSFDLQRQAIINGIDSAQAEATGWDAVVKALQGVAGVVRTSNTQVTITLDAQATYNITATETITVTVPSAALTGAGGAVVATPTFAVTAVASANGNRNLLLMGCG